MLTDKDILTAELKGSLLEFTKFFYYILTGRKFVVSEPAGRESHHITIAKALVKAARLQIPTHRLIINTPPGSGKSTLLCMWVAWTMSQNPDSKYIYCSYSKTLADKQTEMIKRIMMLPEYESLFDIQIRRDSKAKDYFQTTAGGIVAAAGSTGTVTGLSAGSPALERFSGALICDDLLSAVDAHSNTIRESVNEAFSGTLMTRLRGKNTPAIVVGQRLHEADICAHLLDGKDGYDWTKVIIKSVDEAGNIMYPEVYSRDMLLKKKETDPYVFSSQYQQEPIPAGGALFKEDWFVLLDEEPEILYSFVVADTAETSKSYNDATAFGFFGVYEIEHQGRKTGEYGLHWIDAWELRIEPKDLKDSFLDFWGSCMRYKMPPKMAAIEKKSTGVTLISLLEEIRTIRVVDIPRTRESGSKTKRFLDAQPSIAERRISLPRYGKHTRLCLEHMVKITANDSHAHDDLADILVDAIRMALQDKSIIMNKINEPDYSSVAQTLSFHSNKISRLKRNAYSK